MIDFLAYLMIISLTVYIAKSAEPIYLYFKKRINTWTERSKIKQQARLAEWRGFVLIEKGYELLNRGAAGTYFIKVGSIMIKGEHLYWWTDKQFKQAIDENSKEGKFPNT